MRALRPWHEPLLAMISRAKTLNNLFSNEEAVKELRDLHALELIVVKLAFIIHKLVSIPHGEPSRLLGLSTQALTHDFA
jgi:hypothetical protein